MKNKALIILGILFLTFGAHAEKSSKISVRVNNYNAKITSEEAKNLALNHSKVSKTSAKITKLILGKENKKLVYEVEFTTLNKRYRYGIDANTGQILAHSERNKEFETSMHRSSRHESAIAPAPIADSVSKKPKQGKEDLENIYGTRLGMTSKEMHIANPERNSKMTEGNTLSSLKTMPKQKSENKTDYVKVNLISEEEAREIILHNISDITDSDITRLVIKYENDRFIYSGKVNYNGNEYVIKLDGVTGKIIK